MGLRWVDLPEPCDSSSLNVSLEKGHGKAGGRIFSLNRQNTKEGQFLSSWHFL